MRRLKLKMRYLNIAIIAFVFSMAALYVHYAPKIGGLKIDFKGGSVVASTRDQYFLGAPIVIDAFSGTVIENGRLIHILPSDRDYVGSEAQALLLNGQARLALENTDIKIGKLNNTLNASQSTTSESLPSSILKSLKKLKFSELLIRNSDINIALPGDFAERLNKSRLTVRQRNKGSIVITGTAVWRGQNIKLDVQTGPLHDTQSTMPLRFSMQGPNITLRFNGALVRGDQHSLEGNLSVNIKNSWKFAEALNLIWPSIATTKSFTLSGPVKWSSASIAFDRAEVRLDENKASGALTFKTSSKRPLLSGTLAFDKLNLTPGAPSNTGRESFKDSLWLIAASLWSKPMITVLDADLRLSAKQVLVGPTVLDKVAATLSLKNNKVSARLASLSYEGGSGTGQLTINFDDLFPRTTIRGKINRVSLADMTETLLGARILDGPADVTVDIEASGTRLQTALGQATGHIKIDQSGEGALALNLMALTTDAKATSDGKPQTTLETKNIPAEILLGKTKTDELIAFMDIKNGTAECTKCEVKFGGSHLAKIDGHFDLLSHEVDMKLLLQKQQVERDQGGQKPTTLKAIRGHLVSVKGQLLHPNLNVSRILAPPETPETFKFKTNQIPPPLSKRP